MSMPVFAAFPPEVLSAALSTGPGAGPLFAAATALQELAAQYTEAAGDLLSAIAASAAEIWEGPSAEQFRAAHQPFLAWLAESAAQAAAAAAQHETVAGAYETALASMPTLAELAANHAAHAVLAATNFLGINTIPLALNELDYARMWIQAATTMSLYQAASEAAIAAMPQSMAAPPITNPGMSAMSRMAAAPNQANAMSDAAQSRALLGDSNNRSSQDLLKDLVNQAQNFIDRVRQGVETLTASPALLALAAIAFATAYEAFFIPFGSTTWTIILSAPFLAPALALGLALPLGLGIPAANAAAPDDQEAAPDLAPAHSSAPQQHVPVVSSAPAPLAQTSAGSASPAPASPPPSTPATLSPAGAEGGYGYAVAGEDPPGAQFGPTSTTGASASASSSSSASAAAAAASSAQESSKARRAQNARTRGRGRGKVILEEGERMPADGFMDLEQPAEHPTASEIGAGLLGFAGAAPGQHARAAGFTKLPDGTFQTGPTVPMLPQTWAEETPDER